jgi:polyhydroxyalkanoate synthase
MDASELRYGLGLAAVDPASLAEALAEAAVAAARRPKRMLADLAGLALAQTGVAFDVGRTLLGAHDEPIAPAKGDRRFADRAWTENALLRGTMESYLVSARWLKRVLAETELPDQTRRKAEFALDVLIDALAPTNVPWLNPTAVKEAFDTGGLSAVRGLGNFVDDLAHRNGMPKQVDTEPFTLGETLAATPGRVVFRNDLIELIAYHPTTETVYERPLVYSPPWINKYYILDLAPGRSFVEHAVAAGFTVFAISYRNPNAEMSGLLLDDYMRDGLLAAIERAAAISGSPVVNLLAVCLGGTLSSMTLAVLAARGEADRVGSLTLLNALVDFSEPGQLGAFTDERTIERIAERNERRGYMSGEDMAGAFTFLRSNDLVWNYVVSNWYAGKQPPAFDVLAWNDDAPNLPSAMHAQYLRACYLENALVEPGAFELDGTPIDLSAVETPTYVIGSEKDHIAPWRGVYRTTQLLSGPSRFVLSNSGHVAGMVQPPGGKSSYRLRDDGAIPAEPDAWLAGAELVKGSWWDDWAVWEAEHSGARVAPPQLPDGVAAPGTYVRM